MQLRALALLAFVAAAAGVVPVAFAQATTGQVDAETPTATEMLKGSQDALTNIQGASQEIQTIIDRAQDAGDEDAVVCSEGKKANVDAAYGVAQIADGAMRQAISDNQLPRANFEYRKVRVMESKANQFLGEARGQCLGDGVAESSTTSISTNQPPGEDDETDGPGLSDGVIGVDPPGTTPLE